MEIQDKEKDYTLLAMVINILEIGKMISPMAMGYISLETEKFTMELLSQESDKEKANIGI